MSAKDIKNKITKSLDSMDGRQLKPVWLILKELRNQEQYKEVKVDIKTINKQIAIGIQQLDNGEGTDFREFLNEMQAVYGNKK